MKGVNHQASVKVLVLYLVLWPIIVTTPSLSGLSSRVYAGRAMPRVLSPWGLTVDLCVVHAQVHAFCVEICSPLFGVSVLHSHTHQKEYK